MSRLPSRCEAIPDPSLFFRRTVAAGHILFPVSVIFIGGSLVARLTVRFVPVRAEPLVRYIQLLMEKISAGACPPPPLGLTSSALLCCIASVFASPRSLTDTVFTNFFFFWHNAFIVVLHM